MILTPEEGEPGGAGVGVAAEGGVEIMRVEGAAEEMGRMGAWREGGAVVVAADAMIGRGYAGWKFLCEQGILGDCVGNGRACWGLESDWHWVRLGVEEARNTVGGGMSWFMMDVYFECECGTNETSDIAT